MMPLILVVDDDEGMRKSLAILLGKKGYRVMQVASGESAIHVLSHHMFDLVITDLRMEGINGIKLLEYIQVNRMNVPAIIMTGYGTIESAVTAMQMGAYDYIVKPFEYEEILLRVKRAIDWAASNREMDRVQLVKADSPEEFSMVLGKSAIISDLKRLLRKVSIADMPVLLTGETGTGKSFIAKAIHLNSPRTLGPFVPVTCTSIPEHLFESELFGHAKGAFTGAIMERIGLFEAANKGTIFLDEIGAVPKSIQIKLLGVLQDKAIRRVGSNREIPIDTRVIAATNTPLLDAMRRGDFREDLYYRINVLSAHIPALRDRKDDIPFLAEHFLFRCSAEQRRENIRGFALDAMERLSLYDYPGNVRELFNIVCNAVALSESDMLSCQELPTSVIKYTRPMSEDREQTARDIKEWEKQIILDSIARHPRNLDAVSRELKIGRTTLWRKMKQYKIDVGVTREDEP
jgi:DNA-binding NtrC family response regulator